MQQEFVMLTEVYLMIVCGITLQSLLRCPVNVFKMANLHTRV